MSEKQKKDIESIKFFMPDMYKDIEITKQDELDFLEYSEYGKHKERISDRIKNGFNALVQGKRWRGIHMKMYEDGVTEGSVPYYSLLKDDFIMPRVIVDFLKKEMFKGKDAELIENVYQELCLI